MAALAAVLPLSVLAASDLKPVDFEEFQCGDSALGVMLTVKLFGQQVKSLFDHVLPDGKRADHMTPPDADGWRKFEFAVVETDRDSSGSQQRPFRKWDLTGRMRRVDGNCELSGLTFKRDWVADVGEHVIDKCFRYFAFMAGYRSEDDLKFAIRLMNASRGNLDWITRTVIAVKDDPIMEINPSGQRLRMAYGQHVLQCQRDIEQGRLVFEAADVDELRRTAKGE